MGNEASFSTKEDDAIIDDGSAIGDGIGRSTSGGSIVDDGGVVTPYDASSGCDGGAALGRRGGETTTDGVGDECRRVVA
jgi:hypothetical protein